MSDIQRTTPDSWRMLRDAIDKKRTYVAFIIRRSGNQVDHWCIAPPTEKNPDAAGDINPLDFLITLLHACGRENAVPVVDFICRQFGGSFKPDSSKNTEAQNGQNGQNGHD